MRTWSGKGREGEFYAMQEFELNRKGDIHANAGENQFAFYDEFTRKGPDGKNINHPGIEEVYAGKEKVLPREFEDCAETPSEYLFR